jgi:hypothetical protein
MLNYSLLFLHPHDKHFRVEEILSQKYYYTSFSAILYYKQLDVKGWTCSYIFQPFSDIRSICYNEHFLKFYKFLYY